MQITGQSRFIVKPFTDADAPAFVAAVRESNATVGKWMPWAHDSYTEVEAMCWFAHCLQEREKGSSYEFGIFDSESNMLVGGCGINQFNTVHNFCNLGYWVRESWQRKGAGLAAIESLCSFAFKELKMGRVEIVAAIGNEPSLSLAKRAGAVKECLARNRIKVWGKFTDAYVLSFVPPFEKQELNRA